MSKITNDALTRSGTGCFLAGPLWQQWVPKGWHKHSANHVTMTNYSLTWRPLLTSCNHGTMQSPWNICLQGRPRTFSLSSKSSMQILHC